MPVELFRASLLSQHLQEAEKRVPALDAQFGNLYQSASGHLNDQEEPPKLTFEPAELRRFVVTFFGKKVRFTYTPFLDVRTWRGHVDVHLLAVDDSLQRHALVGSFTFDERGGTDMTQDSDWGTQGIHLLDSENCATIVKHFLVVALQTGDYPNA